MTAAEPVSRQHHHPEPPAAAAYDPVCGMAVDPAHRHAPRRACRPQLCLLQRRLPGTVYRRARTLSGRCASADRRACKAGEVLWTCPMHPQIVRKEPGTCPICGMALEPMTPTAGDTENPELRDMTRRFWVGVALSVPLLAMAMAEHFDKPALDALISPRLAGLGAAGPRHAGGAVGRLAVLSARLGSVVIRRLNMFTLIALGTGVAYVYSLVAALAPGIFPASFRDTDGAGAALFRGGGGHRHAGAARPGARAARALARPAAPSARLLDLAPKTARVGCATTAAKRTCRSTGHVPAIACACGPARKSRSTAWCSRATARSMNR